VRLAPNTDTVPASVNKYLLPDERQIISVHQHPAVLMPPFAAALGGVFAAIAASAFPGDTGTPKLAVLTLMAFLILKAILNAGSFSSQYLVVTPQRIIQITGLFVRKAKDMPLTNLDEMTLERSFTGRILGYGTFRIGPESDGQQVIDYVPYPEQLYLEVKAML
jgi:uncharacterized membrane protein YdbT with pleckstrin-like domain